MERILEHWRDLDHREPTLKIVCLSDYSRKRFGLFPGVSESVVGVDAHSSRATLRHTAHAEEPDRGHRR